MFGATIDLLLLSKKRLSCDIMEGFCHIGYHGRDPNMVDSADYCVADNVKGGQADVQFCSLACLRQWFSNIIDRLEQQLQAQKSAGKVRGARSLRPKCMRSARQGRSAEKSASRKGAETQREREA